MNGTPGPPCNLLWAPSLDSSPWLTGQKTLAMETLFYLEPWSTLQVDLGSKSQEPRSTKKTAMEVKTGAQVYQAQLTKVLDLT